VLIEPQDRARAAPLFELLLDPVEYPFDPVESPFDAPPPGGDQLYEQREILDTGSPLGLDLSVETLDPANGLTRQPANLRNVARDREHLGLERAMERLRDTLRKSRLELGRRLRKRLQSVPCALEHSLQTGLVDALPGQRAQPVARSLDGVWVHVGTVPLLEDR